jgi:hypothetical protein
MISFQNELEQRRITYKTRWNFIPRAILKHKYNIKTLKPQTFFEDIKLSISDVSEHRPPTPSGSSPKARSANLPERNALR